MLGATDFDGVEMSLGVLQFLLFRPCQTLLRFELLVGRDARIMKIKQSRRSNAVQSLPYLLDLTLSARVGT